MIKSHKREGKPLTLGILGGGQLAKMTAQAAYRMGLDIAIIEKGYNSPAGLMTKNDFGKGWNDRDELKKFIALSDAVTLENEFIDPDILEEIEQNIPVYPSSKTMRLVQDKLQQKNTFASVGISTPKFAELRSIDDCIEFGAENGYPYLIKTRRNGYDGYGNFTVKSKEGIQPGWDKFKKDNPARELMAESFVNFTKELAVMAVRNKSGEIIVYPCVETIQQNHICHKVIAPADINAAISSKAQEIAKKCIETINGVGIFGIEMFLTNDGDVIFNEIAPRPHNSGHYTIEGCYTSQFENCIRAVLDMPLGSSEMVKPSAIMINLLGEREGTGVFSDVKELLKENVYLHLYGKESSRVGRKMGHLTAIADDYDEANNTISSAYKKVQW